MLSTAILVSLGTTALASSPFGTSSVRKSINYGANVPTAHHSLDAPSSALSAFNSATEGSLIAARTCSLSSDALDCTARILATDFVRKLHPNAQFDIVDAYFSKASRVFHIHLLRVIDGIPVANGNLNVNVDIDSNQILSYGDSSHPIAPSSDDWATKIDQWTAKAKQVVLSSDDGPQVDAYASPPLIAAAAPVHASGARDPRHALLTFLALQASDDHLDGLLSTAGARVELLDTMSLHGDAHALKITGAPYAVAEAVPATLVYVFDNDSVLQLAWKFEVETAQNHHEAYVQADSTVEGEETVYSVVDWVRDFRPTGGELGIESLLKKDLVNNRKRSAQRASIAIIDATTNAAPVDAAVSSPSKLSKPSYKVFPWGVNAPDEGSRKLLKGSAVELDNEASPAGWHTVPTNVPGGIEISYTDTRGNNVIAQENWEGGNAFINNKRPNAGANMTFAYPIHMPPPGTPLNPKAYIDASVSELFYTNNEIHDLFYRYGFDEVAGNFQETNFARGGLARDAVQANAQDGSGVNNANFATPPDGQRPRMRMFYWNQQQPYRDGAFEAGIVIHEYAHGISTRLTGGPANSGCLGWGEAGGMGEGWGDAFATLIRMSSDNETEYSMGSWASGRAAGIRNYPYSRNLTVNLDTYSALDRPAYFGVHAIGEVWAEMLFEMAENLIEKHGFESTLFPPAVDAAASSFYNSDYAPKLVPKAGNTLAVQLIVDGMKLQPCRPSFANARDAILTADKALTGGDNACLIWKAFSKRGLGPAASVVGGTPWGGGRHSQDFTLPLLCRK